MATSVCFIKQGVCQLKKVLSVASTNQDGKTVIRFVEWSLLIIYFHLIIFLDKFSFLFLWNILGNNHMYLFLKLKVLYRRAQQSIEKCHTRRVSKEHDWCYFQTVWYYIHLKQSLLLQWRKKLPQFLYPTLLLGAWCHYWITTWISLRRFYHILRGYQCKALL